MSIKNNIQSLQEILNKVNALPEAGTDLPALDNEGLANDLLIGKQLIDNEGNVVTGTMTNNGAVNKTMDGINTKSITVPMGYTSGGTISLDNTIDNEVDTQADLMEQIQTALAGKSAGGTNVEVCQVTIINNSTRNITCNYTNDKGQRVNIDNPTSSIMVLKHTLILITTDTSNVDFNTSSNSLLLRGTHTDLSSQSFCSYAVIDVLTNMDIVVNHGNQEPT